jgi:hypothetical protein
MFSRRGALRPGNALHFPDLLCVTGKKTGIIVAGDHLSQLLNNESSSQNTFYSGLTQPAIAFYRADLAHYTGGAAVSRWCNPVYLDQ